MTTGKRALIVDDSRSARVILSRMLEQHGMVVDTAESAEQALEYLQQGRPDVIFMDHLMPGMDGFEAVQAIKSDVQTATIPLMMYTSQEGELYVSQARALGAVGVLPKTVRPVDVSRVLYQLHLLPDRRQQRTTLFERAAAAALSASQPGLAPAPASQETPPMGAEATPDETAAAGTAAWSGAPVAALAELQASLRQSIQQLVKDQLAEQRRFMLATFEAFARRLGTEIKENTPPKAPAAAAVDPLPIESQPRQWWPVVLTALLGVIPAVVLGALYWKALDENRAVARQVTELKTEITDLADKVAAMPPPMTFMSPSLLPSIPQALPVWRGAGCISAGVRDRDGPAGHRVRSIRRNATGQWSARSAARGRRAARGAARSRPDRRRVVRRRFLPDRQPCRRFRRRRAFGALPEVRHGR